MAYDPLKFGLGTPFNAQLEYFKQKINLPTERWDDITREAHDKAFIVAGVSDMDLLQDLREAVEKAIAEGRGIEDFRKDFRRIVKARGWTGWTGEGSKAGEAWRTKIIYSTNMSTSYNAGRYAQLTDPDFLKLYPNWEYVHDDSVEFPRPIHQSWDGVVLPHDHPFWQTHFTPNGWGCHCRIEPRRSSVPLKYPPAGWDAIDPRTGEQVGIDKGFGYAPGANVKTSFNTIIERKLINLDSAVGTLMWEILKGLLE